MLLIRATVVLAAHLCGARVRVRIPNSPQLPLHRGVPWQPRAENDWTLVHPDPTQPPRGSDILSRADIACGSA
ncbi:hypothetical protein GN956_G15711 [Arapaima gigas]